MTEHSDEAKVRAAFKKVTPYSHSGYFFIDLHVDPTVIIGGDVFPGVYKIGDESAAWSAAAAYTDEHAQKIAEVDEEIDLLTHDAAESSEQGWAREIQTYRRIIESRQAARAELMRGWRESK